MDEQTHDEQPIPELNALFLETPLVIGATPVPLHDGAALHLESKRLGPTQWALTIEQSRSLVRVLKQCLDTLSQSSP